MAKTVRSFKNFLEQYGNAGVKRVATEYFKSDDSITLKAIAENNNLTNDGIKKLLYYAIVNCIVTYKEAIQIKSKAHRNQVKHMDSDTRTPSDKYYETKVFPERLSFIKNLNDEKVKYVTNFYLRFPTTPAEKIAEKLGFSLKELNVILIKGIVFNIIDSCTLEDLITLQIQKTPNNAKEVVSKLFKYISLRERYLKISGELALIYLKLEAYNDYLFKEDSDSEQERNKLEEKAQKLEEDCEGLFGSL